MSIYSIYFSPTQGTKVITNTLAQEIGTYQEIDSVSYTHLNSIRNADKIIVLDQGHVMGIGTHQELINTCPIYKEICLSQMREDEL